jgi:hypothetical protein
MTTEPAAPLSLSRVGNGVVISLIALSILAHCVAFAIASKGGASGAGLLAMSKYLNMAVLPGTVLAFVKLLLMSIRRTWRWAGFYLLILLFPFLGGTMLAGSKAADASRASPEIEPESGEYLSGRDWARANIQDGNAECSGSNEFNRGCRAAIYAVRQETYQSGREWARQQRPARPSECQGELNFVAGCHNYLLEVVDYMGRYKRPEGTPPIDHLVERPTTAEECVREVNAIFEVDHAVHMQSGFANDDLRAWHAELNICRQLDRRTGADLMKGAYGRIGDALAKLKAGESVTEDERMQIEEDEAAVAQLGEQSYRTSYRRLLDEYRDRLSGQYRQPDVELQSSPGR